MASRHSTGLHLSECCTASVLHNVANVMNVMETRGGVAGGMETEALPLFLFGAARIQDESLDAGAEVVFWRKEASEPPLKSPF